MAYGNIENNIEWYTCGKEKDRATASFSQQKMINRMKDYKEKYPDEIDIYENPDGSILTHFPTSWIKVTRPPKRELTDEQRAEMAERLKLVRENNNK